ncbi:MAG: glycosyltransferase [Paludibacteraceae bacterium]|nr:glycosyltransferase [Paludibacteraceae bacterium]
MKLSIIVPIYNVAPYLRKCVDSLLVQDIEDYEIILVDDGSTDGSGEIADRICDEVKDYSLKVKGKEHSEADTNAYNLSSITYKLNIKVVHQENAGLSAARNAGIAAATGDYIMFVDSDDYLQANVLGTLLEQVERDNLDVLRFDYQNVRQAEAGEYEVFQPNKFPHQVDTCREVVDGGTYLDERMGYACYAWQFVINRELTGTFTPGIHYEDTEWLPRMMLAAKRVNSTPIVVYNYLVRQGSITQAQGNKDKLRKNVNDFLFVIESLSKQIIKHPSCQWLRRMISSMAAGVLTRVAMSFYDERKEYIRRLQELNVFPLVIADQGKTYARRARIINLLGARVYCWVMKWR